MGFPKKGGGGWRYVSGGPCDNNYSILECVGVTLIFEENTTSS